ncbi:MAG: hypothetical protein KDE15_02575 [Erythrobacter sp.]|nr:hypothetical protein [Erythrobacter sp.]
MQDTTAQDRRNELKSLLERIHAHPEHAFVEERKRVAVLQSLLRSQENAEAGA